MGAVGGEAGGRGVSQVSQGGGGVVDVAVSGESAVEGVGVGGVFSQVGPWRVVVVDGAAGAGPSMSPVRWAGALYTVPQGAGVYFWLFWGARPLYPVPRGAGVSIISVLVAWAL